MKKSKAPVIVLTLILALLATSVSGFSELPVQIEASNDFTDYELQKFQEHTENRLPDYVEHFKKYSELYQVPWALLAAVAYQESKWNHKAVSYTGVKGIMQITAQTAEHIGLEDPENPIENIKGGAYYLRYLYDKTSPQVSTQQRWIHALAAYNLGWGHFRDAYRLAKKLNKNPYDWKELKTILPKLNKPDYLVHLRYGPARGGEAVHFVNNVFSYYMLINKTDNSFVN